MRLPGTYTHARMPYRVAHKVPAERALRVVGYQLTYGILQATKKARCSVSRPVVRRRSEPVSSHFQPSRELCSACVRLICPRLREIEQGGQVGSLELRIEGMLASETAKLFKVYENRA